MNKSKQTITEVLTLKRLINAILSGKPVQYLSSARGWVDKDQYTLSRLGLSDLDRHISSGVKYRIKPKDLLDLEAQVKQLNQPMG